MPPDRPMLPPSAPQPKPKKVTREKAKAKKSVPQRDGLAKAAKKMRFL